MRIGVLTGGGDCPGLNAVIRAIVRKGVGRIRPRVRRLSRRLAGAARGRRRGRSESRRSRGILPRGGTILGSSRTNPFKEEAGAERLAANLERDGVDGLIAIGGEDTLGAARGLHDAGVKVVGVPKTIDNDLGATDYTFGFDTAVNIAMEAIDRLHTTAESHQRVLIVEVMGRHAGWIALHAGLAGGANVILIPEHPFDIERGLRLHRAPLRERVLADRRGRRGRRAQGRDAGRPGCADGRVRPRPPGRDRPTGSKREIEGRTGYEARATVLGHVQRGGTPTAFDRVLATRFGLHAIDAAHDGRVGQDDRAARAPRSCSSTSRRRPRS